MIEQGHERYQRLKGTIQGRIGGLLSEIRDLEQKRRSLTDSIFILSEEKGRLQKHFAGQRSQVHYKRVGPDGLIVAAPEELRLELLSRQGIVFDEIEQEKEKHLLRFASDIEEERENRLAALEEELAARRRTAAEEMLRRQAAARAELAAWQEKERQRCTDELAAEIRVLEEEKRTLITSMLSELAQEQVRHLPDRVRQEEAALEQAGARLPGRETAGEPGYDRYERLKEAIKSKIGGLLNEIRDLEEKRFSLSCSIAELSDKEERLVRRLVSWKDPLARNEVGGAVFTSMLEEFDLERLEQELAARERAFSVRIEQERMKRLSMLEAEIEKERESRLASFRAGLEEERRAIEGTARQAGESLRNDSHELPREEKERLADNLAVEIEALRKEKSGLVAALAELAAERENLRQEDGKQEAAAGALDQKRQELQGRLAVEMEEERHRRFAELESGLAARKQAAVAGIEQERQQRLAAVDSELAAEKAGRLLKLDAEVEQEKAARLALFEEDLAVRQRTAEAETGRLQEAARLEIAIWHGNETERVCNDLAAEKKRLEKVNKVLDASVAELRAEKDRLQQEVANLESSAAGLKAGQVDLEQEQVRQEELTRDLDGERRQQLARLESDLAAQKQAAEAEILQRREAAGQELAAWEQAEREKMRQELAAWQQAEKEKINSKFAAERERLEESRKSLAASVAELQAERRHLEEQGRQEGMDRDLDEVRQQQLEKLEAELAARKQEAGHEIEAERRLRFSNIDSEIVAEKERRLAAFQEGLDAEKQAVAAAVAEERRQRLSVLDSDIEKDRQARLSAFEVDLAAQRQAAEDELGRQQEAARQESASWRQREQERITRGLTADKARLEESLKFLAVSVNELTAKKTALAGEIEQEKQQLFSALDSKIEQEKADRLSIFQKELDERQQAVDDKLRVMQDSLQAEIRKLGDQKNSLTEQVAALNTEKDQLHQELSELRPNPQDLEKMEKRLAALREEEQLLRRSMEEEVNEAKEAALEKLSKWQQREMLRLGDIMTGEYERQVERMQNEVNEKIQKEFNHIQRFFKALGEEKADLAAKKIEEFLEKKFEQTR